MTSVKLTFAVHEVVVLTGFTKYMLDYLVREDIFAPYNPIASRGRRRSYSYADVVLLRALFSICAGRGKVRYLKASLAAFRQELGPISPGLKLDQLLTVEGDKLCVRDPDLPSRELLTGQMIFSFVLDLREASAAVAEQIIVDPATGVVKLTPRAATEAEAVRQAIWAPIKARRALSG